MPGQGLHAGRTDKHTARVRKALTLLQCHVHCCICSKQGTQVAAGQRAHGLQDAAGWTRVGLCV